MINKTSIRFTYFIGFLGIILLLGIASYLEIYKGINPCPLCILQRVIMIMLGVIFFFAMILRLHKLGYLLSGLLGIIVSLSGILLSGRQVWLQNIPQIGLGECGISLQYMFKIFSFTEALQHVWRGGTECSQQGWVFLHLSLAEWSLICFLLFFLLAIIQLKRAMFDLKSNK
jgi:protein dithiol:quinone oxidoreductase